MSSLQRQLCSTYRLHQRVFKQLYFVVFDHNLGVGVIEHSVTRACFAVVGQRERFTVLGGLPCSLRLDKQVL
jgi:hypothetical protein